MPSSPPVTQNADIRFLGRLLGDVIRAYGGQRLFDRIETIRALSVDRHRGVGDATAVARELESLDLDATLEFVRGFMLFSMLANLAEDRQSGADESHDDLASALKQLQGQGVGLARAAELLDAAHIAPVLTAHPTEVMRKSMIDHRNRIALLLRYSDAGRTETPEGDLIEQAILRQIALLWQTRPLRRERLYVADEVDIALTYLRDILLPVLPTLYARWERLLNHRSRSFLRLGSWIGGDRDGNPNVTADSLRFALGRSSQAALSHYLDELHALGAELSLSTELTKPSAAVIELADRSGDVHASRRDEPYRRAITGIYARLAATYVGLFGKSPVRQAMVSAAPYQSARRTSRRLSGDRAFAARGWRRSLGERWRVRTTNSRSGHLRLSSCHIGFAAKRGCACSRHDRVVARSGSASGLFGA